MVGVVGMEGYQGIDGEDRGTVALTVGGNMKNVLDVLDQSKPWSTGVGSQVKRSSWPRNEEEGRH